MNAPTDPRSILLGTDGSPVADSNREWSLEQGIECAECGHFAGDMRGACPCCDRAFALVAFGYLGERATAMASGHYSQVVRVDAWVIEQATARGWDAARLFTWLNSKDARHFADQALYSNELPAGWAARAVR